MPAFPFPDMAGLLDKARTRIASPAQYLRKVREDRRYAIYDLLPIVTDPRLRDRLAGLIALRRPRTSGFAPSATARDWCRRLETDGITPLLPPIDAGVAADLRRHFEAEPCHDPYRPHLGRFHADAPPSREINMGYYAVEQILRAPHVLALLNDRRVLETAELYLGCKPLLDNIGCWWSFGDREVAKGTQRLHRDLDSLRGFKVFFYLTDVDEAGGPHVFVKGSHRSPRLGTGRALPDAEVAAAFGADRAVSVTGPAGSWFLVDTYGFHKGAVPRGGRRLLLTAQYNINRTPHAPRQPVLDRATAGYDPFVNQIYLARLPA